MQKYLKTHMFLDKTHILLNFLTQFLASIFQQKYQLSYGK